MEIFKSHHVSRRTFGHVLTSLSLLGLLSACSGIKVADQVPWVAVPLSTDADLLDVVFTDDQTGWLVGSQTSVFKTQDGGKTWQPAFTQPLKGDVLNEDGQRTELKARFISVDFTADGREGWIAGKPRLVLHTQDGGKSWFAIPLNKRIEGNPIKIIAFAAGTAEMVMDTGFVFKTTNGGKVWRALTPTSAGGIRNVDRLADGSYVAVSVRGSSYLTWKPGDQNWQLRERESSRRIQNLVFVNETQGWMLNSGGEVQGTQDSGKTWSKPYTPDLASAAGLLDAAIDGTGRLWITGGNGTLLSSKDQGKTWEKGTLETKGSLFRIKFVDKNLGFIMGQKGTLLRFTAS